MVQLSQLVAKEVTPVHIRLRILGLLPLMFFLGQAIHYWRINEFGHVLWMCNIGNLLLAAGFFFYRPMLIRVAVIWMVPGLVVWVAYVVLAWGVFLSSTLAHVGGIAVGMIALRTVRMDRWAWVYALAWYFAIQLLSYLITPAALNVNVAHAIAPGWEQKFDGYWRFWVVLALVTVAVLWVINLLLYRLWPSHSGETLNPQP